MSGCTGYQSGIDTPKGVFRPELPSGIQATNDAIHFSRFENWICKQALVGGQVVQNFEYAKFETSIRNPDPTEKNSTFRLFVFEWYSNSPAFVALAASHGLSVALVQNVSVKTTDLGQSFKIAEYSYPPGSSLYTVQQQLNDPGGVPEKLREAYYYLNGTHLARAHMSLAGKWDSGNEGLISFGPETYWARHSDVTKHETLSNFRTEQTISLSFDAAFESG